MKFLKRLFVWPFRKKRRQGRKRVYAYRGANNGRAPSNHRNTPTSSSPSFATWPTPEMLAELGARRVVASQDHLPIVGITQTRVDLLSSDQPLFPLTPDSERSNRFLDATEGILDENSTYPQSNKAVRGSDRTAYASGVQSVDDGYPSTNNLMKSPDIPPDASLDERLHPSYNVTVHRKKLHAITQMPGTYAKRSRTLSSLAESSSSSSSQQRAPTDEAFQQVKHTRARSKSLNDSHLLYNLTDDDPAMLDALRLFYDEDPAHMFKNSPLRPEIGPKSLSDGMIVERSTARLDRSLAHDISMLSSAMKSIHEEGDITVYTEASNDEIPGIAPLNLLSPLLPLRNNHDTSQLLPRALSTSQLRLSSPILYDLLFSNSIINRHQEMAISSASPSPSQLEGTSEFAAVPTDSYEVDGAPPRETPMNKEKDNIPPPMLDKSNLGLNSTSTGSDQEEDLARDQALRAVPTRSHDSAFYSLYSSPPSLVHRSTSSVDLPRLDPHMATSTATKAAYSTAGSEIIEAYANMTTYDTDSEEEKMIETAIISTWESARLTALLPSPSDMLSPTTSTSTNESTTLSPASTFELRTPTLSLHQRRTSHSYSPQSRKRFSENLVSPTPYLGWGRDTHVHLGSVDADAGGMEPLIHSSLDEETDRIDTAAAFPSHSLPSSPLDETLSSSMHSYERRPRPAGLLRPYPFSVAGTTDANPLFSTLASASSPHRGIVGLDGGSNREAFLYGQDDDEGFAQKLDFRLASFRSVPKNNTGGSSGTNADDDETQQDLRTPSAVRVHRSGERKNAVKYTTPLNDVGLRDLTPTKGLRLPRPFNVAASAHVDGLVETQRPRRKSGNGRSKPQGQGRNSLGRKLGLSPKAYEDSENHTHHGHSVRRDRSDPSDVFGTAFSSSSMDPLKAVTMSSYQPVTSLAHFITRSMPSLPLSSSENRSDHVSSQAVPAKKARALSKTSSLNHPLPLSPAPRVIESSATSTAIYTPSRRTEKYSHSPQPSRGKSFTTRIPRPRALNTNIPEDIDASGVGSLDEMMSTRGRVQARGPSGATGVPRPRPGSSSLKAGDQMAFGASRVAARTVPRI